MSKYTCKFCLRFDLSASEDKELNIPSRKRIHLDDAVGFGVELPPFLVDLPVSNPTLRITAEDRKELMLGFVDLNIIR